MALLHPALRAGMTLLPSDRPLTLLTRHSVRELAANGVATYDLPLTPEGIVLAEQWGGQLGLPLHAFYSSPVGRCMDTARAMARGAGREFEVQISMTLVEPGCFVHGIFEVGPLFLKLGPLAFANRHFQEPMPGILSPAAGVAKIVRHLQQSQGDSGSLTVHVTHDTILAAFIYHLQGQSGISEEDWPWMMEGAWLWFDEADQLHWVWRAQPGRQSLATLLAVD